MGTTYEEVEDFIYTYSNPNNVNLHIPARDKIPDAFGDIRRYSPSFDTKLITVPAPDPDFGGEWGIHLYSTNQDIGVERIELMDWDPVANCLKNREIIRPQGSVWYIKSFEIYKSNGASNFDLVRWVHQDDEDDVRYITAYCWPVAKLRDVELEPMESHNAPLTMCVPFVNTLPNVLGGVHPDVGQRASLTHIVDSAGHVIGGLFNAGPNIVDVALSFDRKRTRYQAFNLGIGTNTNWQIDNIVVDQAHPNGNTNKTCLIDWKSTNDGQKFNTMFTF